METGTYLCMRQSKSYQEISCRQEFENVRRQVKEQNKCAFDFQLPPYQKCFGVLVHYNTNRNLVDKFDQNTFLRNKTKEAQMMATDLFLHH